MTMLDTEPHIFLTDAWHTSITKYCRCSNIPLLSLTELFRGLADHYFFYSAQCQSLVEAFLHLRLGMPLECANVKLCKIGTC